MKRVSYAEDKGKPALRADGFQAVQVAPKACL